MGRNHTTGKKPVDMSVVPEPTPYQPPSEHHCTVINYPIDLVDGHQLHVNQWIYHNLVVWFAIMQRFEDNDGVHEIARIDCCHGVIHRHVFNRRGEDLANQQPILELYSDENVWASVDACFNECYERMLDEYMANYRRWSQ